MKEYEKQALQEEYGGYWGENDDYPISDWIYEVVNNDTRSGYWDWVINKMTEEN